ncbi:MAG: MATE family efflux transporter [Clostridia bacterium]|nr:MATE family efflux transporter [Clostridia bacterium]
MDGTGKRRVGRDLTQGNIIKTLLIFAIPILLTNIVQQLYNTVDLIIIGQFAGKEGTVGTSTGGDLANLLTMLSIGFSAAGEVYIAQLSGARNREKLHNAMGTLLTLMMGISVACGALGVVFSAPFLKMLNTPQEAFAQAQDYMVVTSIGMPFVFGYNAVCSIMRGMGESRKPLLFVSVAAVSNIIMDLFFVAVLDMKSLGTAIATVAAQLISFLASVIYMYRHQEQIGFEFKRSSFRIHKEALKVIVRLGIPRAAQTALINVSLLYCSSQINLYGVVASATNSVGNKVTRFTNIVTNSVDAGAASMIAQNLGARKPERAKKVVYTSLAVALTMMVLNVALALLIPDKIFAIFSREPEVIELGIEFMHITIIAFVLSAIMGPYGAMVTGSGNASLGFVTGVLDGVVLRIGLSILFAQVFHMGVYGYFYGNAIPRIAPCIINLVYFYGGFWKRKKLLTE